MMCTTVPTTGSAANADVQTNDSLNGVHDVNTFEFINGADNSVLMTINKENGLDINMDTVITPPNAIDPPLTMNSHTDKTLFIIKTNKEVVASKAFVSEGHIVVRKNSVDVINQKNTVKS